MALVNYASSDSEASDSDSATKLESEIPVVKPPQDGDKVEPEYRMRVPRSAKLSSVTSNLPNLTASRSKTGKVLLSVPTLEGLDSSSSDEDSSASKKSTRRGNLSTQGSATQSTQRGLLSLLPPTRGVFIRDRAKASPMIPQQLAVKRAAPFQKTPTTLAHPKPPVVSTTQEATAEDDTLNENDELDTDNGAYFSFYQSESTVNPTNTEAVANARAAATNTALQALSQPEVTAPKVQEDAEKQPEVIIVPSTHRFGASRKPTTSMCSIDANVIKEFRADSVASSKRPGGDEEDEEDGVDPTSFWTAQTFVPGPERKRALLTHPGSMRSVPIDDLLSCSNQLIREVSQSDLTAGSDVALMKSITSEESQYVKPRPKTDDAPGKLAHQKHQITWLAFQAQENEVDLEKRWAAARSNKSTNRAKYGF